jgi:TDG/mug DNA glycosylase family protein
MAPTKEQVEAARDRLLPDVLADGLDVVFCGINPGLWSAATGHHFARPGNRFWPALHAGGFTPRLFRPDEQTLLPELGLGLTNVAPRATARADELTRSELEDGGRLLVAKVRRHRPGWLAVLGVTAYRSAFAEPTAAVGPQDRRIGTTGIWVLPNPSGLNAHWTPAALAAEMARLRQVAQPAPRAGHAAGR